jgi:predicted RNase H-like HicB family nuclease
MYGLGLVRHRRYQKQLPALSGGCCAIIMSMEVYTYPITVEREGRKYYAYSEDLPGVYGLGKTIEEAKASIVEAMRIFIRECRSRHQPIPRARTVYSETISLSL